MSLAFAAIFGTMSYFMSADIRELISLDDVMEELGLGPNGGLIYCMEYVLMFFFFFLNVLLNYFNLPTGNHDLFTL